MRKTADLRSKIQEIYSLEQLAAGSSPVHDRHPLVKLVSAFCYIVLVVSFGRAEFGRLVPFVFYGVVLMALSGTPWTAVLKRAALALPFVVVAGLSNVIFDRAVAFSLAGITVSVGVVSFFTLIYRTFLCVTAVLLLVAVTPVNDLTFAEELCTRAILLKQGTVFADGDPKALFYDHELMDACAMEAIGFRPPKCN